MPDLLTLKLIVSIVCKKERVMLLQTIFWLTTILLGMNGLQQPAAKIAASEKEQESLQYRVAFDLGSGNLKMQAAWVDPKEGRIVALAAAESQSIPVRDAIDHDPNHNIPEEIVVQLASAIQEMQRKAENQAPVSRYVAGATDAYRVAGNGSEVLGLLAKQSGLSVYLLSQNEEAALGYGSLKAEGIVDRHERALIWENGGGSTQFTREIEGSLQSYHKSLGKVPMKNHLIQEIQKKALSQTSSPNPISREEAKQAIAWAAAEFHDAPSWVKERPTVLGIGAMFPNVQKGVGKGTFTKADLWQLIEKRLGKSDQELSPKPDPNAAYMLSDLLFLYGAMEALQIEEVLCPEMQGPGNTSGLLIDGSKWL
jgi:exopolyphosphatase / guanosine-5'-triphosphate,3'-diphosphate pyrophosphatase